MKFHVMTKEWYFKQWTAYFMIHKLDKPMLGFQISVDRIDVDLLYISLGMWR